MPVFVLTMEHESQLEALVLSPAGGGVAQYAGFVPVPLMKVHPHPDVVSKPLFVQPDWVLFSARAPVFPEPGAFGSHEGATEVLPDETLMLKVQSEHFVPKAGPVPPLALGMLLAVNG